MPRERTRESPASSSQPDLSYIIPDLRALAVPISSLREMEGNARVHDERNLNALARSLDGFKQVKPIVVAADGTTIIAGNGTFKAAKDRLHWEYIAVVKSELEGTQAVSFALADNRTTDLSLFDDQLLRDALELLNDDQTLAAGFEAVDIERLFEDDEPEDTSPSVGGMIFKVIVTCGSEREQGALIERLEREGLTCHPLTS